MAGIKKMTDNKRTLASPELLKNHLQNRSSAVQFFSRKPIEFANAGKLPQEKLGLELLRPGASTLPNEPGLPPLTSDGL
jgi:hypothetical protein